MSQFGATSESKPLIQRLIWRLNKDVIEKTRIGQKKTRKRKFSILLRVITPLDSAHEHDESQLIDDMDIRSYLEQHQKFHHEQEEGLN